MKFFCSSCGQKLELPDDFGKDSVFCLSCGEKTQVPKKKDISEIEKSTDPTTQPNIAEKKKAYPHAGVSPGGFRRLAPMPSKESLEKFSSDKETSVKDPDKGENVSTDSKEQKNKSSYDCVAKTFKEKRNEQVPKKKTTIKEIPKPKNPQKADEHRESDLERKERNYRDELYFQRTPRWGPGHYIGEILGGTIALAILIGFLFIAWHVFTNGMRFFLDTYGREMGLLVLVFIGMAINIAMIANKK